MPEGDRNGVKPIEDVIAAKDKMDTLEEKIAVLFAGLCDSTAYKLNRGDSDGLVKTYRHNRID